VTLDVAVDGIFERKVATAVQIIETFIPFNITGELQ
jgi:hypothetical protein